MSLLPVASLGLLAHDEKGVIGYAPLAPAAVLLARDARNTPQGTKLKLSQETTVAGIAGAAALLFSKRK